MSGHLTQLTGLRGLAAFQVLVARARSWRVNKPTWVKPRLRPTSEITDQSLELNVK